MTYFRNTFTMLQDYHWNVNFFDTRMPMEIDILLMQMREWQENIKRQQSGAVEDLDTAFGYHGQESAWDD